MLSVFTLKGLRLTGSQSPSQLAFVEYIET